MIKYTWIPPHERIKPPWIKGPRPWVVVATFEPEPKRPDPPPPEPRQ